MTSWLITYTAPFGKEKSNLPKLILEEENQSVTVEENHSKTHSSNKGRSSIAIFHRGEYIGSRYPDVVDYLNKEGLMLC